MFSSNRATESTASITSTEFVQYLEDDRVEEYSIQPTGGVYEIRDFQKGEELKTPQMEKETFHFSGNKKSQQHVALTQLCYKTIQLLMMFIK